MKTNILFSILLMALLSSCADFKPKKIKSTKNMDLEATSAPIDGYNYYNMPATVPPSAPKMKKEKTSKNTTPAKKTSTKVKK